jgi:uncharacterized protein YheU (UPF0270 family)
MYEIIEIPFRDLSSDALSSLIDAFIAREGTDYGEFEMTTEDKKNQVMSQLMQNKVAIIFDEASESCTILPRDQLASEAYSPK